MFVRYKDIEDAEIKFWNEDLNTIFKVVNYLFNNCKFKQNETCGNHIHIRFENNDYYKLFTFKKVYKYFIKCYTEKWNNYDKYILRLNNKYCKAIWKLEYINNQLKTHTTKSSKRYTAINFNSINLYNTLEFRIAPYFNNFEEFKEYVLWFIETIDKIIDKFKDKELVRGKIDAEINNLDAIKSLNINKENKIIKKIEVIKNVSNNIHKE